MAEVLIDSIRVSLMNYQRVVILKERGSERFLPIWIGSPEADAIAVRLQDVTVPRPLTHDLMGSVIAKLGAQIQRIVVTNLESDTFFAKIVLKTDGGETEIDCRPSDAIALAVRGGQVVLGADGQDHWFESFEEAQRYRDESGVDSNSPEYAVRSGIPIFVEESVLQVAGVRLDGDDQVSVEQVEPKRTAPPATEISADELTSMSAFSEFLKELPGLEELGEDPKD